MSAVAPATSSASALSCSALDVMVAHRLLVRDLTLDIERGTVTCILGCNGAGKTLTLHTLAGIRESASGTISVGERILGSWPRKQLARELGLLTQTTDDPFPSTVLETVLIGRHPHIDFWQWESEVDKEIARAALRAVGSAELESRDITTLSGGERRRVAIATLLAQDPNLLLLDEPINHLDPHHQIELLRLMRSRAANGRTVIMSLHDAGLAARFADYALLLFGNGEWQFGTVGDTLNAASISKLYGMRVHEVSWPGGRMFAPE
jgi:iron complex transport system ATP-binding protein